MKELLSIEEKATRYDEAIDLARKINSGEGVPAPPGWTVCEVIFPELRESEDERIRKALIRAFKSLNTIKVWNGIECTDILAWLEKQGEHANFRNKIQIGDKVTRNEDGVLVNISQLKRVAKPTDKIERLISQKGVYYTCIKDYYSSDNTHLYVKGNIYKSSYNGYINDESHFALSWTNSCMEKYFEPTKDEDWIICEHNNVIGKPMQYKEFKEEVNQKFIKNLEAQGITPKLKLWTINDAKDGDVLAVEPIDGYPSPFIAIYKERGLDFFNSHCFVSCDGEFHEGTTGHDIDLIHPATKEQCNVLMKVMADARYTFDFEKKELKEIKQKTEWSEEDETMITDLSVIVHTYFSEINGIPFKYDLSEEKIRTWFNSLKDRIYSQPQQEWNEENEIKIKSIIAFLKSPSLCAMDGNKDIIDANIKYLKSLKYRVIPQLKQEWSKEDEEMLDFAIRAVGLCRQYAINHQVNGYSNLPDVPKRYEELQDWLKSLRPQKQWKPSDEQMAELRKYSDNSILRNLYYSLKKLKEK